MTFSCGVLRKRLWLTLKSIGQRDAAVQASFDQACTQPGRRFIHHTQTERDHVNSTLGTSQDFSVAKCSAIEQNSPEESISEDVPHRRDGGFNPALCWEDNGKLPYVSGEKKPEKEDLGGVRGDAQPRAARTYWRRIEGQRKYRKSRQIRRYQYQRHNSPDHTGEWQPTLRLLEQAMPNASSADFAKRMTTITSHEGAAFVFKGNTGSSVLDIMNRSGAHVQIVPDGIVDGGCGFTKLALWANSEQRTKAMSLLPDYVRYVSSTNPTESHEQQKTFNSVNMTNSIESMKNASSTKMNSQTHFDFNQGLSPQRDELAADRSLVSKKSTSSFRAVWSGTHLPESSELDVLPVDLPGTSLKLSRQIKDLTSKRLPLRRHQLHTSQLPTGAASWSNGIVIELENLLLAQRNLALLAPKTLDLALSYLLRHRRHPSAYKIFKFLRQHNYQLTSSHYASLCAVAARDGHVRNFHMIVVSMLKQRVAPSPEVWVQFLQLVIQHASPSVVQTLRSHMMKTGLLSDRATAIDALELTTTIDLETHMSKSDTTLKTFVKWRDDMAKELDVEDMWFTRATLNRMVHYFLGRNPDPATAFEAVDVARSRNINPTTNVLNGFLAHAKHHNSVHLTIQYLRRFALAPVGVYDPGNGTVRIGPRRGLQMPLVLDNVSYKTMFQTAWAGKHWNCLRVLWVFAGSSGNLDKQMLEEIRRSLNYTRQESKPTQTSLGNTASQLRPPNVRTGETWRSWIGEFVLEWAKTSGGETLCANPPMSSPLMETDSLADHVTAPVDIDSEDHRSRRLKQDSLLQAGLDKLQELTPKHTLVELLEEAYKLDKTWRTQHSETWYALHDDLNADKRGSDLLSRMIQTGIKVPVEPGDGTKFWSFATSVVDARLLPGIEKPQPQ
ncbi:hypothetical protein K431DRAFT_280262 [Polychaeton citri CBS 116435]|uniref:Uncharacterized protein n=1 Tax=Polychaeton citri CBS 116435 TaxID=1314669 RepID=A0A9P4QJW7_9PEZI|nr:hypothetical protein K431DRAFT_280262 [Polychaeton citri CBS 116435]